MAEWFDKRLNNDFHEESPYLNYCHGVTDAIAYANTILQTVDERKRPFLSDDDIEDYSNGFEFTAGAKWTRDRYEEMLSASGAEPIEQWKPQPGDKCAIWHDGNHWKYITETFIFQYSDDHYYYGLDYPASKNGVCAAQYCALIENDDEIGKPPSYFINRGKCTVRS
jgi:hypothetical protein